MHNVALAHHVGGGASVVAYSHRLCEVRAASDDRLLPESYALCIVQNLEQIIVGSVLPILIENSVVVIYIVALFLSSRFSLSLVVCFSFFCFISFLFLSLCFAYIRKALNVVIT